MPVLGIGGGGMTTPFAPVWLSNFEWMMSFVPRTKDEFIEEVGVLRLFQPLIERWIAGNRVAENPDNQMIVRRALEKWDRVAVWSMLDPGYPTDDLRSFSIRLKGLLPKAVAA